MVNTPRIRPGVAREGTLTPRRTHVILAAVVAAAVAGVSCDNGSNDAGVAETARTSVRVEAVEVVERPLTRFIRVTGTLTAQEQSEVAAETTGRIVETPVERGTPVSRGGVLVRISAAEVEAQLREARANVAQIQARLGQSGKDFDLERVPEVAVARASHQLAEADFDRSRMLFERKLVSQAEFDLRRAQAENAGRQYESARNSAEQQRQSLAAAEARLSLAEKALADTSVRAPFDGVVAERLVSVGDYVTRGTRVAVVMRVNPLRLELTVPAQFIPAISVGRPVALEVDSLPGRVFTGEVRYVSPGLRADSRALVVEAIVPNEDGALNPGLFVTARIEESAPTPGLLVPVTAVRSVAGTARVFVVTGDRLEERIVTAGQVVEEMVEVTSGLQRGEVVATGSGAQLIDGVRVSIDR